MATVSTFLLNKMADAAVNAAWTARPHTGNPGNNGASNRITAAATPAMAAANWSNASAGDVTYDSDLAFGVIDADTARTVNWLSFYEGGSWTGNIEVSPGVAVAAGGTLTINSGTIDFNGATV